MDGRRLAIWAGVEPSVVRVGDRYVDQIRRTGHHDRVDDLDRIAALGVTALRYPVLWERVAPDGLASADWAWSDERLGRLRTLGIEPIVTLLHHGSGPPYTNLLDEAFPAKLGAYAGAVARRYPWVRMFTPINEPLTTARFSALYGHWYPHRKDDVAFATALLNQVAAVGRAMAAIREHTPNAMLVQTEDIGKTYSTGRLSYQARFENARRWSSIDLLCGRFQRNTAMRAYLESIGCPLEKSELAQLRCEPDILGFNYYVTSERFLDHRLERYPAYDPGGNGRDRYVDLEAVRASRERMAGIDGLFAEAWRRYRRPLAITEAHLACTPHEQMRWLEDVYAAANRLRNGGVDLRAMTVWATFGAYDWNSLLTRDENYYEAGCFDARTTPPRPTLLARWTRARAEGTSLRHAALRGKGWWRDAS